MGIVFTLLLLALITWLIAGIAQGAFTVVGLGSPLVGILVILVILIVLARR